MTASPAPAVGPARPRPPRILVAEDEGIVAEDLASTLQRLGYAVAAVVGSAEEALEAAQRDPPDLAIMDIRLRGAMDGIEAAFLLRSRLDVPVVYLTAYADPATVDRARSTEPYGYLRKPFDEEGLRAAIEVALTKHQAEAQRREAAEAKALLASIVANSQDAILSTDLEGTITSWNPSCEAMYGYTSAEILGRPIRTLVPEDRAHEVEQVFGTIRADKRLLRFETERLHKDGHRIPISLTVSPVLDDDHAVVGLSSISHDITQRLRIQEELRRALEELRRAHDQRSEVFRMVAHDLRSPLTALRLQGSILRARPEDSDVAWNTGKVIERGVSRLDRLAQDLLDLVRIEQKQLRLEFRSIDLARVVQEGVDQVAAQAGQRSVRLTFAGPGELPVQGDATRLAQVVGNLLDNALKFTPEGGSVDVLAEARDGWAEVQVKDSGRGFPPEKVQDVFAPFVRIHEGERGAPAGTGLGLPICKGLVEAHGGRIWAHSDGPGEGATFGFALPLAPAPPGADPERGERSLPAGRAAKG